MKSSIVIIPTYDEKENAESIIRAIFSLPHPFDILIVDDNSPDGTANIVRDLQKIFPERLHLIVRKGKLGLGTAYIEGFRFALQHGYEYIFEMDCDFSHNPKDLIRLYNACATNGYDMAVGSRYVKGGAIKDWPLFRLFLSKGASIYVQLITGLGIKDATAGFVCYTAKVLQQIDLDRIEFIGYAFQIEMKFKAKKNKFSIIEIPIIFQDRKHGESKISKGIVREGILGTLQLQWDYWRGKL